MGGECGTASRKRAIHALGETGDKHVDRQGSGAWFGEWLGDGWPGCGHAGGGGGRGWSRGEGQTGACPPAAEAAPGGFLEEGGAFSGAGLVSRLPPRPLLAAADAIKEEEGGGPGKPLWQDTLTGRRGSQPPAPGALLLLPTSRPGWIWGPEQHCPCLEGGKERVPDLLQHISLQTGLP